jgi:rubredoxin
MAKKFIILQKPKLHYCGHIFLPRSGPPHPVNIPPVLITQKIGDNETKSASKLYRPSGAKEKPKKILCPECNSDFSKL